MPMTVPVGQDYHAWDNVQEVRFEHARRAGAASPAVLPVAKGRAVTKREKSPSGGVYLGFERNWLVPRAVLPANLEPAPGDVVVDGDGTRWTVLTCDQWAFNTVLRLGCVNLTLAHDLRDAVDVERAALSQDAAGAYVKTFPPAGGTVAYGSLPCRVQLVQEEIDDQRGIRGFLRRYDVTVDRQVTVTNEDRLKLADGTYLDVVGYRNATRIDELPVIEALGKV